MKPITAIISFVILFLVVVTAFFGQSFFSVAKNTTENFLASISSPSKVSEKCEDLARENERLKFELSKYKKREESKEKGVIAQVFSRYPFNNKERIVVNRGKEDNIKTGAPVLSPTGYLLGKVVKTKDNKAEIQTIFAPKWKSSVAIGSPGTKAVIKGGQPPELELIPKESQIFKKEKVFNISPDFPYKKLIGKAYDIKKNPEKTWYTGLVEVPYNFDEITSVTILPKDK